MTEKWSPWTEREIEILQRHYYLAELDDLLSMLPGRTRGSIRNVANRLGLTRACPTAKKGPPKGNRYFEVSEPVKNERISMQILGEELMIEYRMHGNEKLKQGFLIALRTKPGHWYAKMATQPTRIFFSECEKLAEAT